MRKEYAGHAKRVMLGVWSFLRQFTYTKLVIVTDDDVDVRDWKDVVWALSTRVDPARDTTFIERSPIDYLDFASPVRGSRLQDGNRRHLEVARRDGPHLGPAHRDEPGGEVPDRRDLGQAGDRRLTVPRPGGRSGGPHEPPPSPPSGAPHEHARPFFFRRIAGRPAFTVRIPVSSPRKTASRRPGPGHFNSPPGDLIRADSGLLSPQNGLPPPRPPRPFQLPSGGDLIRVPAAKKERQRLTHPLSDLPSPS